MLKYNFAVSLEKFIGNWIVKAVLLMLGLWVSLPQPYESFVALL